VREIQHQLLFGDYAAAFDRCAGVTDHFVMAVTAGCSAAR